MNWKKYVHLLKKLPLKKPHLGKEVKADTLSWRKVKTACILILFVGNVVLLALAGILKGYDWYLSNQTRQQIDAMLAERGILCGSSVYRTLEDCPQAYTVRADGAVQKAFAEALLTGTVSTSADKGNTTVWIGENGTVSWSASGDVWVQAALSSVPEPQNAEQAKSIIKNILKNAGIEVRDNQFTAIREADGSFAVEVKQELNKIELIGCSLTAAIGAGNEVEIIGKWCTGEARPVTIRSLSSYSSAQMIFTIATAQSNFSQIVSAQPAYLLSNRSGGRFITIPCWRFSTDSGKYILNIVSGDVILSSGLDGSTDSTEK